jgi:hypothetical protein
VTSEPPFGFELVEEMCVEELVTLRVTTAMGPVLFIGNVLEWRTRLVVERVHVQGLKANILGAHRLMVMAQQAMEWLDVDEIVLQGGLRTSGAQEGRFPAKLNFRRRRLRAALAGG